MTDAPLPYIALILYVPVGTSEIITLLAFATVEVSRLTPHDSFVDSDIYSPVIGYPPLLLFVIWIDPVKRVSLMLIVCSIPAPTGIVT